MILKVFQTEQLENIHKGCHVVHSHVCYIYILLEYIAPLQMDTTIHNRCNYLGLKFIHVSKIVSELLPFKHAVV